MEALREEAKQSTAQNVKQLPGRSKRYTVTKRIIDIVLSLIASLVLLIQHGLQCLHVITPHIRAGAFQQPGAESRVCFCRCGGCTVRHLAVVHTFHFTPSLPYADGAGDDTGGCASGLNHRAVADAENIVAMTFAPVDD